MNNPKDSNNERNGRLQHMESRLGEVVTCRHERRVGEHIAASEARMAEQIAASEARTNARMEELNALTNRRGTLYLDRASTTHHHANATPHPHYDAQGRELAAARASSRHYRGRRARPRARSDRSDRVDDA